MLEIASLVKNYGAVQAIRGIDISVQEGEIFTFLGPSGCGKTTTLQSIAGLETPTSGQITMAGEPVFDSLRNILVPANRRRLGMVFQSYAIWPHMSVFENVAFPVVHGSNSYSKNEIRELARNALKLVKMDEYIDRPAPHLSGGQQQRIALARAIVHKPRLLLLDEPLSNLDAKLRDTMRVELRQLIKDLGITTIFVTHDQTEALSMSDRIVLMKDGEIVQVGTPREVYLRPETSFTADFMGRSNLVPATLTGRDAADTPIGRVQCVATEKARRAEAICVAIRPQAIATGLPGSVARSENTLRGIIEEITFLGDVAEATVNVRGTLLRANFSPYDPLKVGDEIELSFSRESCVAVADVRPKVGGFETTANPRIEAAA